jgi:hypothetical protein
VPQVPRVELQGGSVFAKLATVIIVLGAMFGALLVNRQQRIDAAAEISRSHFRMQRQDRERTAKQADVAAAVRPDRLREKLAAIDGGKDSMKPIPFRYDPTKATDEALDAGIVSELDDSTDGDQQLGG